MLASLRYKASQSSSSYTMYVSRLVPNNMSLECYRYLYLHRDSFLQSSQADNMYTTFAFAAK